MAFKLEPADEDFLTSAPSRYSETFAISGPAADVWRRLTSDTPLDWFRILSVRWTSGRPFGVGTTRQVKVLGAAMKLQEHFFVWEESHRYAFCATEANLPVFRRLAEDYLVEPDGPDRCRFTWTFAVEPSPLGKPGAPLNGLIFKQLFAETRRRLAAG